MDSNGGLGSVRQFAFGGGGGPDLAGVARPNETSIQVQETKTPPLHIGIISHWISKSPALHIQLFYTCKGLMVYNYHG